MVFKAIYDILSNVTAVTNLISTRIYNVNSNQEANSPYVTVQQISNIPNVNKDITIGLRTIRIQINIVSSVEKNVNDIAAAILAALHGVDNVTKGGLSVQSIRYENENDAFSYDSDHYTIIQDYIIRIKY